MVSCLELCSRSAEHNCIGVGLFLELGTSKASFEHLCTVSRPLSPWKLLQGQNES